MKEPASLLGEAAVRAAIAKGQGRTMLALREPDGSIRYADTILDACLHNRQFDRQCEANRIAYLLALVDEAGLRERLLEELLKALPTSGKGWDRDQILDLLGELAKQGDEQAWNALVSRADEESVRYRLAECGEKGLSWFVEHALPTMPEDELWQIKHWLPEDEADDCSESQKVLRRKQKEYEASLAPLSPSPREKKLTPPEFLLHLEGRRLPWSACWDFANEASSKELREAAERFLIETKHGPLQNLRRVFQKVRFPLPLAELFAQAEDEMRGWAVCKVLSEYDDPEVRDFALDFLHRRPLPRNATSTIQSSFRPGDEVVLAELLLYAEGLEGDERHGIVLDLVHLMAEKKGVDWQPFAQWVYEHSPCSYCRYSAVDRMMAWGTLPDWIRAEALYDAEAETREAVVSSQTST